MGPSTVLLAITGIICAFVSGLLISHQIHSINNNRLPQSRIFVQSLVREVLAQNFPNIPIQWVFVDREKDVFQILISYDSQTVILEKEDLVNFVKRLRPKLKPLGLSVFPVIYFVSLRSDNDIVVEESRKETHR